MKWLVLVVSTFTFLVAFFQQTIEKKAWLKVTKAYASVVIFVIYGFVFSDEAMTFVIVTMTMMLYTLIRNSIAFIKSYKLSEFNVNLHIAIVNVLQIIIAYAVIYKFLYIYLPNSFNADFSSLSPFEIYLNFIYFSTVTFTTLGYGDIVPTNLVTKCTVITEVILFLILVTISISFISRNIINSHSTKQSIKNLNKTHKEHNRKKIYGYYSKTSKKRRHKESSMLKYNYIIILKDSYPLRHKKRHGISSLPPVPR